MKQGSILDCSYYELPRCVPVIGNNELLEFAEDWVFRYKPFIYIGTPNADELVKDIWIDIKIPKGYRFSASIPWWAQPVIGSPTSPEFWVAAGAHDYAFETHCMSFDEANQMFEILLKKFMVSRWKRVVMRKAVSTRIGRAAYDKIIISDLERLYDLIEGRADRFEFLQWILVEQWQDVVRRKKLSGQHIQTQGCS